MRVVSMISFLVILVLVQINVVRSEFEDVVLDPAELPEGVPPNFNPHIDDSPTDMLLGLDETNFEDITQNVDTMLVMFSSRSCGNCRQSYQTLDKAAKTLVTHDPPIYIGIVDGQKNPEIMESMNATTFPTSFVFHQGKATKYPYSYSYNTVVKYLEKVSDPHVTRLSKETYDTWYQSNPHQDNCSIVAFVDGYGEEMDEIMWEILHENLDEFNDPMLKGITEIIHEYWHVWQFGVVDDENHRKELGRERGLLVHRLHGDGIDAVAYHGDYSRLDLLEFISMACSPLVDMLDYHNEGNYMQLITPRLTIFPGKIKSKTVKIWKKKLNDIAKEYMGRVVVVLENPDANRRSTLRARNFGFKKFHETATDPYTTFGMGVIEHHQHGGQLFRSEATEYSDAEFRKLVDAYLAGTAEPYVLSEEEPEVATTYGLTRLVGKTMNHTLYTQTDQDVLVAFVAYDSEPCMAFMADYVKIALKLEQINIKVAFYDIKKNVKPPNTNVLSVPLLFMYKADKEIIPYPGIAGVDMIIHWVNSTATEPLPDEMVPEVTWQTSRERMEAMRRAKREKQEAAEKAKEEGKGAQPDEIEDLPEDFEEEEDVVEAVDEVEVDTTEEAVEAAAEPGAGPVAEPAAHDEL